MAFGSVASSKVKVILEAQDHVTATLNKLKQSFSRADRELDARLQQRAALHQEMAAWDRQHSPTAYSYQKHLGGVLGYGGYRSTTIEPTNPELMKRYGLYNPFISGAHVVAALSMQTNRLYANTKRFVDGLIKANQWMTKASAKLNEVGGKLAISGGMMTGVGVAGLTALYKPLSDFGDFQRNMLEAQVKSGASAAQYDAMTAAARSYAANSSWDPQQVSSVMAKMASMGFAPDQITNSFRQIMDYARAVGQDDPMWAAQGIGAMLNSFGIDPSDSSRVREVVDMMTAAVVNSPLRDDSLREAMKQVAPLVQDKQGTIGDMLAWNMAMAQKGIDGSIAGTAQKNFLSRLGKKEIVDYMAGVGVNVYDERGNRRAARQILADIAEVKRQMSDAQWDQFSDKVFGMRSQAGINAMFDEGLLEKAYSALGDAGGLSEQIREHMESGVFGSLKRIWSAFQDMLLEVGKSLENVLKEWEPQIIDWLHWATEEVNGFPRFTKWIADALVTLTEIGAVLTTIGGALLFIANLFTGIQGVIAFTIGAFQMVILPVVTKLAWLVGSIFATFGAIGGALVLAAAALVGIVAWTGDWASILQGMFNGGDILQGIALIGKSFVMTFKMAAVDVYYALKFAFNKVLTYLWGAVKGIFSGILYALSYIPGLGALDEVSKNVYNSIDLEAGDKEINREWTRSRKDVENEYREYLEEVKKYKDDAIAQNTSQSKDVEKRGRDVAMPKPQNDEAYLREMNRREAQARSDWAKYILPKNPYDMPSDVEKAEKIIAKVRADEEKIAAKYQKEAEAKANAVEKEEEARKKEEESARKAAERKAQAEEKQRQAEEKKAQAFKASQLQRQAELTKSMKPIFQGSMEAAKWLHGLGEYSKEGKTDRELAQEQVDHLASIDEQLKNGEVVFQGV